MPNLTPDITFSQLVVNFNASSTSVESIVAKERDAADPTQFVTVGTLLPYSHNGIEIPGVYDCDDTLFRQCVDLIEDGGVELCYGFDNGAESADAEMRSEPLKHAFAHFLECCPIQRELQRRSAQAVIATPEGDDLAIPPADNPGSVDNAGDPATPPLPQSHYRWVAIPSRDSLAALLGFRLCYEHNR